jgi:hypothetical protein
LQSPGFAMLNSELAFVLPFATLFLVYPHIWVYCKHHLNQELFVCAWMVCLVQHGVLFGLLYNWCKHTEMAVFHSKNMRCGPYSWLRELRGSTPCCTSVSFVCLCCSAALSGPLSGGQ